jgi:hypothetical protein
VTERFHGVVLVGDGNAATELLAAGVNAFVIFDREVTNAVFDDATDTWTLTAEDGEFCRGRVVVNCESPLSTLRCQRPISTRPAGALPSSAPIPAPVN